MDADMSDLFMLEALPQQVEEPAAHSCEADQVEQNTAPEESPSFERESEEAESIDGSSLNKARRMDRYRGVQGYQFVYEGDLSYKSHVDARAKALLGQQERCLLPQLNKKLAASRRKKLKIERRLNLEASPVPQKIHIGDLELDQILRSKRAHYETDDAASTKTWCTKGSATNLLKRATESFKKMPAFGLLPPTVDDELEEHTSKLMRNAPLLLFHEHPWQGAYLEQLYLMHFEESAELKQFKYDLPKNEERRKRARHDWAYYLNNSRYVDLVWRNKNDAKAFIVLELNSLIDSLQKPTTLFDIKTIASSYGLYSLFDWDEVERQSLVITKLVESNQTEQDYIFSEDARLLLEEFTELKQIIGDLNTLDEEIFLTVPKLVMWSLSQQLSTNNVRIFPIRLRYKLAVCIHDLQLYA